MSRPDCKPHEMMKNFISLGLQSNKYDTQQRIQLAGGREFDIKLQCILTTKKYFHRLEQWWGTCLLSRAA